MMASCGLPAGTAAAQALGEPRRRRLLTMLSLVPAALLASHAAGAPADGALRLQFRSRDFVHRWSMAGQHEFTPSEQTDLKAWRDMITFNVHAQVASGEQLAEVANKVLGNYQRHGKVLQTRSTPRDARQPAQHLAVAVLGKPDSLEAAFARFLLHEGAGLVVVVSHRIQGKAVGPEMSRWLATEGQATEEALMGWRALPSMASLQHLPRSVR